MEVLDENEDLDNDYERLYQEYEKNMELIRN